jgi:hypothetical protein
VFAPVNAPYFTLAFDFTSSQMPALFTLLHLECQRRLACNAVFL